MSDQFPGPVPGQSNPWGPPAQQHGGTDPETGRAWPTDRCMVTVGFHVLARCGAPAAGACGRCGRGMCPQHGEQTPAGVLCLACSTEQNNYLPDPTQDPSWAARYRRRYREQASRRFADDRMYWSFNRYDTHYTTPGPDNSPGWDDYDHDHDVYDS